VSFMIYGATGFTGELIAKEAIAQGKAPILAGRNAAKVARLGSALKLPSRVFQLGAPSEIAGALQGVRVVLNCAGPFSNTAGPMMRACIDSGVHYADITGEIEVLEGAHRLDASAQTAGVVLCPGAGFDVVPTDCIALMLKKAMPEAHELALGFEVSSRQISAGTAKTVVESLGKSGKVRRAGRITGYPLGTGLRRINFGRGEKLAMPIPAGDIASAFYTTGIPNITFFTPVSFGTALLARASESLRPFLQSPRVQAWLTARAEAKSKGPDARTREATPSYLWGEVRDAEGRSRAVRVKTVNPYSFTVLSALAIAEHLLTAQCPPGCLTPAGLMGEEFLLRLPGTALLTSAQDTG